MTVSFKFPTDGVGCRLHFCVYIILIYKGGEGCSSALDMHK